MCIFHVSSSVSETYVRTVRRPQHRLAACRRGRSAGACQRVWGGRGTLDRLIAGTGGSPTRSPLGFGMPDPCLHTTQQPRATTTDDDCVEGMSLHILLLGLFGSLFNFTQCRRHLIDLGIGVILFCPMKSICLAEARWDSLYMLCKLRYGPCPCGRVYVAHTLSLLQSSNSMA